MLAPDKTTNPCVIAIRHFYFEMFEASDITIFFVYKCLLLQRIKMRTKKYLLLREDFACATLNGFSMGEYYYQPSSCRALLLDIFVICETGHPSTSLVSHIFCVCYRWCKATDFTGWIYYRFLQTHIE